MKPLFSLFPKLHASLYAKLIDWFIAPQWRHQALAAARGAVLEIGAGNGANLPYYPLACSALTMTDYDPAMLEQAKRQVSQQPPPFPVEIAVMDVQQLSFPDHSFDTVISSFVFCTVADPLRGLQECRRVLKPGGTFIALEHVDSQTKAYGLLLRLLQPLALLLLGDNLLRDTKQTITAAGFCIKETTYLKYDFVLAIKAK